MGSVITLPNGISIESDDRYDDDLYISEEAYGVLDTYSVESIFEAALLLSQEGVLGNMWNSAKTFGRKIGHGIKYSSSNKKIGKEINALNSKKAILQNQANRFDRMRRNIDMHKQNLGMKVTPWKKTKYHSALDDVKNVIQEKQKKVMLFNPNGKTPISQYAANTPKAFTQAQVDALLKKSRSL